MAMKRKAEMPELYSKVFTAWVKGQKSLHPPSRKDLAARFSVGVATVNRIIERRGVYGQDARPSRLHQESLAYANAEAWCLDGKRVISLDYGNPLGLDEAERLRDWLTEAIPWLAGQTE
jgi:hypothetical protein